MTFTLYKETRLNCFYVNIAALLKRLPVEDAHLIYLFNQAGLFYRDTEDEDEFQISPYYRLLDDFVYGLFGARLHKTGSSAGDDYMRTLKETLANGKSAIIESDIFICRTAGFIEGPIFRTHWRLPDTGRARSKSAIIITNITAFSKSPNCRPYSTLRWTARFINGCMCGF